MITVTSIKKALAAAGITEWRINRSVTETVESFFVKKQLDTRRAKKTEMFRVTVFRTTDTETGKMKGFITFPVSPETDSKSLAKKISEAYGAALYVLNKDYTQPAKVRGNKKDTSLGGMSLTECEEAMIEALFAEDKGGEAFINSAEIFVERVRENIVSSEGTNVSFVSGNVNGEFVVQCREPEDVEMHNQFRFGTADSETLKKQVKDALKFVSDRAKAQKILKSGNYDVILCGDQVPTVLEYYAERSHVSMIYPKYSEWKKGCRVQKSKKGYEKLDISLKATEPYSPEGIAMKDLKLISKGVLKNLHGDNRFSKYVGVEPTGDYEKLCCGSEGTKTFEEMKKEKPCLVTVTYSDFQMDAFTGHFGGEIRLAYLCSGESVIPVTGGSVNGSLPDAQNMIVFSTDRYSTFGYEGPYAMKVPGVPVAGV